MRGQFHKLLYRIVTFLLAMNLSAAYQMLSAEEKNLGAKEHVEMAKDYQKQDQYNKAIEEYQKALSMDANNEAAKKGLSKCQQTLQKEAQKASKQEFKAGMKAYKKGQYQEAASHFENTLANDPNHSEAQAYLEKSNQMILSGGMSDKNKGSEQQVSEPAEPVVERTHGEDIQVPLETMDVNDSRRIENFEKARDLYYEGKDLYYQGEYDLAKEKFEECLTLNPYYIPAKRYLKAIINKEWCLTNSKVDIAELDRLVEVKETWLPPSKKKIAMPTKEHWQEKQVVSEARLKLEEQTKQIIPTINFNNAQLADVIKYLSGITGINIVIDESVFTTYSPEEEAIEEAVEEPETEETTEGEKEPGTTAPAPTKSKAKKEVAQEAEFSEPSIQTSDRVTISLKNIPLIEALKYILRAKGLKYVIEDYAIVITSANYIPPEEFETRYYHLSSGVGSFTSFELDGSIGDSSDSSATEEGEAAKATEKSETTTIKDVLEQSGVPWPMGSKIFLDQRTGTLIVRNTPTNLAIIEDILRTLDVTPYQINITSRFVEINREDLSSFGLEYFLNDDLKYFRHAASNGGLVPLDALERIQVDSGSSPTRNNRFLRTDTLTNELTTSQSTADTVNSGILAISGILTEPEFTVILHALLQGGNSNLLSAPQITTINGQRAQIEVVTEIIYPTEYDVTPATVSQFGVTPAIVVPASYETRDVGIILDVTPNVGSDKKTINLTIIPEVSALVGWLDYGVPSQNRVDSNGNDISLAAVPILQPVFQSRNVTTSVIVNDGETVILGGLISDEVIVRDDKIPVLGDIPIFGKLLFSHRSEISSKKNLIIFVTAELITPSGDSYAMTQIDEDDMMPAEAAETPVAI